MRFRPGLFLPLLAACAALAGEVEPRSQPVRVRAIVPVRDELPLPEGAAGPVLPAREVRLDDASWRAIADASIAWLDAVPLSDGTTVDLRLARIDPFTPDARIVSVRRGADGRIVEAELPRPALSAWGGVVAGRPDSRAFLSLSDAGLNGWVQFEGRTEIFSSGDPRSQGPIVVSDATALPPAPFTCETLHEVPTDAVEAAAPRASFAAGCRQLPIAVETDEELLAKFSGTGAASGYVATIFAGLMDIYSRDFDGRPAISFLRFWETTDPWTVTSGTSSALSEFKTWWNANMSATPRALATMLSGKSLGGGVAWLSVTCSSATTGSGYSLSASLKGSFPYPLVDRNSNNWDIIVTSHEIGHNMSGRHTHDLGLDDCWDPAAGTLGACTQKATGTIMSYCHQCSGGYTNITLKFDDTNIASIVSHIGSKTCTAPTSALPVAAADTATALQGRITVIDALANDLPANCESVTIANLPATSELGATLEILPDGAPGGGAAISYTAPLDAAGTDRFTYALRDASGQTSTAVEVAVDLRPVLRARAGVEGDTAALQARFYPLTAPASLPDFTALEPYQHTTASFLSFGSTTGNCAGSGRADNFGAVFEGWLTVAVEGLHTFSLTSDAGSRLVIDGVTVIDHDGLHTYSEKTGSVYLMPGRHLVHIPFFEATGSCGLWFKWAPPGTTTRVTVPSTALSRGGVQYDLDASGTVDFGDVALLMVDFGSTCSGDTCYGDPNGQQRIGLDPDCVCPGDLDASGLIDFGDIALLLMAF